MSIPGFTAEESMRRTRRNMSRKGGTVLLRRRFGRPVISAGFARSDRLNLPSPIGPPCRGITKKIRVMYLQYVGVANKGNVKARPKGRRNIIHNALKTKCKTRREKKMIGSKENIK